MKLMIACQGEVTEFNPDPNLGLITIGRSDKNDIALLGEKAASREHVTLERTVDGWKLVDQMSANGTVLNDEKVNFAFLKEGDVIRIGATKIQVLGLTAAAAPAAKPAKQAKHAMAPAKLPARPEGERAERPEITPRKKSPVPALAAAAVAVVALLGGGYFLMNNMGGGSEVPQTADQKPETGPRQAQLSDDEKAALAVADSTVNGTGTTLEKIYKLDEIQKRLDSKRGSSAADKIGDLKKGLLRQLDTEIGTEIDTRLAEANAEIETSKFAQGIERLNQLNTWLGADPYLASLARANKQRIDAALQAANKANGVYVASSYNQMVDLAAQKRFAEAISVADELLANAWLSEQERELYTRERTQIVSARDAHDNSKPVVTDEPESKGSILGKLKEDKDRLPGKNPLLPNGVNSERKLLEDLHNAFVKAVQEKTLTSIRFSWRGAPANIKGMRDGKLQIEYSFFDKRTNEEIPVRRSVEFKDITPEDTLQLYERTPELTDENRLALVIFCYDNGFTMEAATRACTLFKARNDWKEGIDTLIAQKRKILIPEGGFVEFDGMLITPGEKDDILFDRRLRAVIKRFEDGLDSKDKKKREDSEAAFSELLTMGDKAIGPGVAILQEILDKTIAKAEASTGVKAEDQSKKLEPLLVELERRRAYALELIMDEVAYPYPYGPNQAEVQADVNARVAAVREIWNDPTSFMAQSDPNMAAQLDKVRAVAERMEQLDPEKKHHAETPDYWIEYLKGQATKNGLTIKDYAGSDKRYAKLITINRSVMQANEDHPTGERHTDADGRAQVRITNEYRIMFARVALRINDKLFWGAWHHSKYCVENNGGQIAHEIPGEPRGERPGDRMRYEGYPGGGGENIHMNSGGPTPQSSHDAWCNSSGHHRNILHPQWRVLGSGKFRTIWTQKFGSVDEGDQNSVSRGGE